MKRPCFNRLDRYEIKIGYKPMIERFKVVKAGRDLERKFKKDLNRTFHPIITFVSKILTNLTSKSSQHEQIQRRTLRNQRP